MKNKTKIYLLYGSVSFMTLSLFVSMSLFDVADSTSLKLMQIGVEGAGALTIVLSLVSKAFGEKIYGKIDLAPGKYRDFWNEINNFTWPSSTAMEKIFIAMRVLFVVCLGGLSGSVMTAIIAEFAKILR